jgi:phage FluMu protein Com
MNEEKYEIIHCPKCGTAMADNAGHIFSNVDFKKDLMTLTISAKCPHCKEVMVLDMEDYL